MLPFEPIRLEHRALYESFMAGQRTSECSFAAIYSWSHKNKLKLTKQGDTLYRLASLDSPFYLFPMGGDTRAALAVMEEDAKENHNEFVLRALSEEQRAQLETLMPDRFTFIENRDYADYLYKAIDLQQLAGRNYHAKRNFNSRFERTFEGQWQYEDVIPGNLDEVWKFQDSWCRKNDCSTNVDLQEEATCIALLLYNLEALGAKAGLLRANGDVVAFTIGSKLGTDTLEIHIEKADYEIAGAYPMINREFARRHATPENGIEYINREEDLGLEGLRKSKLSYNPDQLMMKYTAKLR